MSENTPNSEKKRKLTCARAISEAIGQEMAADASVFVMGEDIGALGGVFGTTQGLLEEFGPERVRDTPISETAFIGAGVGATRHMCNEAAKSLAAKDISAEVIDLRSFVPLDRETLIASVNKTGRLVVADDDYQSFGVSGEIIATVAEELGTSMRACPRRVAYPDIPVPFSRVMERFALPSADKIEAAALECMNGQGS